MRRLGSSSPSAARVAFTDAKFGPYQAGAYHAGFERTFGLLADFPRIGTPSDELVSRYRRFRFQPHYIFFTDESDDILVRALIHVAINLRPDLFE